MKYFVLIITCFLCWNSQAQKTSSKLGWSFGAEKGYAQIAGEVRPESGFGFGFFGEKPINQFLSARLVLGMGGMRGLDRTTTNHWLQHPGWNGTLNPDVNYNVEDSIYANYKTKYQEVSLQGVLTITQMSFVKNESPFDVFLMAGLGMMRYNTMIDAVDQNALIYDFDSIALVETFSDAELFANLNTIADGNYETQSHPNMKTALLYQFGGGAKWSFRKDISLYVSHRVSITNVDDLDSYLWDEDNTANGINDVQHYTTLGVSYTVPTRKKQVTPKPPPTTVKPEPKPIPEPAPSLEPHPIPIIEVEPTVEVVELTLDEKEVVRRAFENTEFEIDKATIREVSFNSLNELAALLSEHPTWKLRITGHTDNTGTPEWNMDLSRRRVEAVTEYLSKRNIDVQRLIQSWHGEEQPIDDNSTSEGRQRNRRVTYEIVE